MFMASQSTAEQFKWKSCYDCDQWFCGDCVANIVLNSQAETDEFCCSECLWMYTYVNIYKWQSN